MAKITEEQIQEINEVFYRTGNKSQTAREVGVSVASVNKYLIKDYVPVAQRVVHEFDKEPTGSWGFVKQLRESENPFETFSKSYELSEEEWEDLRELQKEV